MRLSSAESAGPQRPLGHQQSLPVESFEGRTREARVLHGRHPPDERVEVVEDEARTGRGSAERSEDAGPQPVGCLLLARAGLFVPGAAIVEMESGDGDGVEGAQYGVAAERFHHRAGGLQERRQGQLLVGIDRIEVCGDGVGVQFDVRPCRDAPVEAAR